MASVKFSGASDDDGLTSSLTFTLPSALAAGDRIFLILSIADNYFDPVATLNGTPLTPVEEPVQGSGAVELAGHGSYAFHMLVGSSVASGATLTVDYSLRQDGTAAPVTRASACYAVCDGFGSDYFLAGYEALALQQATGVKTVSSPVVVSPADALEVSLVADSENDVDGADGDYGTSAWTPPAGMTYVTGAYNTTALNPQCSVAIGVDFDAPIVSGTRGDRLWTATNNQTSIKSAWTLVFSPVNERPVAVIGPDQQVEPWDTFELNGAASTDDTSIASYSWTQLSGPAVTLSGSGAIRTAEAPALQDGATLTFRLVVTDGEGAVSNPADTTVEVFPANEFWWDGSAWQPMQIHWL